MTLMQLCVRLRVHPPPAPVAAAVANAQGGAAVSLTYIASERVIPGYGGGMSSAKAVRRGGSGRDPKGRGSRLRHAAPGDGKRFIFAQPATRRPA